MKTNRNQGETLKKKNKINVMKKSLTKPDVESHFDADSLQYKKSPLAKVHYFLQVINERWKSQQSLAGVIV